MTDLKRLRENRKISQQEIANFLGITRQGYSNYENGTRQADYETLLKLGEFFGVSVDYLLKGQKNGPYNIPVLGYVRAGIPISAVEDILDYEEISAEMASQGEHFALKIKGNSMEPRIYEGDVVIVRQQTNVDSGDIAVVLVNGDAATVKKLVKQSNGIMLQAFNPSYEPTFFSSEEILEKPVQVLGKVVELRGKF